MQHPRKLDKLKRRLKRIVDEDDLKLHRELIQRIVLEMGVDIVDFAAALLQISQPHLIQKGGSSEKTPAPAEIVAPAVYRNVRYRLDVGSKHQVSQEDIIAVLIEESGVDKNRIVRLDMRDTYTLVDLPDGMPADIYQILTEATVGSGHKLNIKRVKPNRRKYSPQPAPQRESQDRYR